MISASGQYAFRGHGFSPPQKKNHFLRGLQTRAFPTGVDCPPAPINHYTSEIKLYCPYNKTITAKEIHGDSYGRKGLGETTQCVAQRRLISRPWKAECISVAVFYVATLFRYLQSKLLKLLHSLWIKYYFFSFYQHKRGTGCCNLFLFNNNKLNYYSNISEFICSIAAFSRRETCAWDIPISSATSICVFP